MSEIERFRELVSGRLTEAQIAEREKEGWEIVAVEWARPSGSSSEGSLRTEIPFGLQVSDDCLHLEENPLERQILELMLDLIVKDKSVSEVAHALNERGLLTRSSEPWTQIDVFEMLPRLIEVAPDVRWVKNALG